MRSPGEKAEGKWGRSTHFLASVGFTLSFLSVEK
jgi:hypothetical protein